MFIKNFDFEAIPVDPFGIDVINTAYTTGVFDKFQVANGKTGIWTQDQPSEMYFMEYDAVNYVNISTIAWTLENPKMVDVSMPDINTMVVTSSSSNTGNTAFELYEYSAGLRADQASWTRTLISIDAEHARGVWDNGTTSNGKLIFFTLRVEDGRVSTFTYNGANYITASGNAVESTIDDDTAYCGEVQSVDILTTQGGLSKIVYTHSRKIFNRAAYGDFLFAANGLLISQYNETQVSTRNGNTTLTESTLYY